jgi:hypothetical protein
MNLTHIFNARVTVTMPPTMLKGGSGDHVIFDVSAGTVTEVNGSGINGVVEPVGGDWAFHPGDDYWRLHIRSILTLDAGVRLHMRARGTVEINDAVEKALATGGEVQFGDAYFVSSVQFDTDPSAPANIALLRHRLGVTQGRFGAGFVEYKMFRIDD